MDTGRDSEEAFEIAIRRGDAGEAGHRGDEMCARTFLSDDAPSVRATAFSALLRMGKATASDTRLALSDEDPSVRRSACEHGANLVEPDLVPLLNDRDPAVVEAAAYAIGEIGEHQAVEALCEIAGNHSDPLCRESAVAALGAIGDGHGRATILAALSDTPAIRRRAVVALAAFDGDDVSAALRKRLDDRDWQVRQAAEVVIALDDDEPN